MCHTKPLSDAVAETIQQSEVELGISWQDGVFLKKVRSCSMTNCLNESLRWLAEAQYENVLIPNKKGLAHLLEGTKDSQRYGDG